MTEDSTPRCSRCGKRATYHQAYSGTYFCDDCFVKYIERKVARTIAKFEMLHAHDRIGVALSGGKDSMMLLHILLKLAPRHRSDVVALTVDEGIIGYRERGVRLAVDSSRRLGVQVYTVSFKELYGFTMDDVVNEIGSKMTPCSACGTLRRRAIDVLAKEAGVTVVATGHNLDDIVQTFLINLMNGDIKRIAWLHPKMWRPLHGRPRRVQPLAELLDDEVLHYVKVNGIPFQDEKCPYRSRGIRSRIREMLNDLERESPGIKHVLFKSMLKISEGIRKEGWTTPEVKKCHICGWPSTSDPCNVCRIVTSIVGQPINMKRLEYEDAEAREGSGG